MSEWRVAKSLLHLRDQVNAAAPGRDKSSDGTIGDASHQSRHSDHDPDQNGLVCAMDISNDPAHGVTSELLAEAIRVSKDPRVQYVISNKKIANMDIQGGAWRPYNGANPHNHHCHISVRHNPKLADDTSDWKIGELRKDLSAPNVVPVVPVAVGSTHPQVVDVKALLVHAVNSESGFGELTEALVRAFQKAKGLTIDGVVVDRPSTRSME